ncbi:LysR family transcriptional regulator, mexEF-oprN operon transcriptional activator [Pseudomonas sp. NFACC23-1]|nr:LysR family transcriptional regulator, mexEF-oprN operon transcriptional activator [Pseudomonas sp. NFACC17-2]SEJ85719.1 LysR family transcriptional regulator, mexEF-oprN operon transcriptional activator [Pseudomonas sp. NFACC23-1]SFW90263.1 LysR family transcriptional regulator, mexEF-oprN operon transcriptional activator [Pseudomonas sp. NFACC16-2]
MEGAGDDLVHFRLNGLAPGATTMMNRNDLRRADINLLVVFETMMHERNVTRVSEKLFLGQPTISSALARLRLMFDDPLFIRSGRLMEPTSRAREIFSNLSPALDGIAAALSRCQAFEPATSEATFHIGLCDDVEYALLPELLRRLRVEAPGTTLVVRRTDQWQVSQLLASGEISLGISPTLELPANARRKTLRPMRPMLLRADSQPGELTLDEFCRRPHAIVSSMGNVIDDSDRALCLMGRQRRVVLTVPQFSALPVLLAQSDMIAIVPDYVAQAMAMVTGMRAQAAPICLPQHELSMVWRGASHNDPGERWLRARCNALLAEQADPQEHSRQVA